MGGRSFFSTKTKESDSSRPQICTFSRGGAIHTSETKEIDKNFPAEGLPLMLGEKSAEGKKGTAADLPWLGEAVSVLKEVDCITASVGKERAAELWLSR